MFINPNIKFDHMDFYSSPRYLDLDHVSCEVVYSQELGTRFRLYTASMNRSPMVAGELGLAGLLLRSTIILLNLLYNSCSFIMQYILSITIWFLLKLQMPFYAEKIDCLFAHRTVQNPASQ